MAASSTTAVGQALYVELTRTAPLPSSEKFVFQLVITPDAMCNGTRVPMSAYRRRLSTSHPRRTWKQLVSPTTSVSASTTATSSSAVAGSMISFLNTTLGQLIATQTSATPYRTVGDPIVVDVSEADLVDVRLGKTPYKVLGRVWKARKAMGYPTEFV